MQVAVTSVSEAERLLVVPTVYPGIIRCVARYGYHDTIHHDSAFVNSVLRQV